MKTNKQNKSDKEISIAYGDDNSINISVFNNKILMEVVGSFDSNLKELERISGSRIYFRGNLISIKGDKSANEKVRERLSKFGVDGIIETRKQALETALNELA